MPIINRSEETDALPRDPIFIPSKGRFARHRSVQTWDLLIAERTPFYLVVEPQEEEAYYAFMVSKCEEALSEGKKEEEVEADVTGDPVPTEVAPQPKPKKNAAHILLTEHLTNRADEGAKEDEGAEKKQEVKEEIVYKGETHGVKLRLVPGGLVVLAVLPLNDQGVTFARNHIIDLVAPYIAHRERSKMDKATRKAEDATIPCAAVDLWFWIMDDDIKNFFLNKKLTAAEKQSGAYDQAGLQQCRPGAEHLPEDLEGVKKKPICPPWYARVQLSPAQVQDEVRRLRTTVHEGVPLFSLEYENFSRGYCLGDVKVNSYNNIAICLNLAVLNRGVVGKGLPCCQRGVSGEAPIVVGDGATENSVISSEKKLKNQFRSAIRYRFKIREDYDFTLQIVRAGMSTVRLKGISFRVPQMLPNAVGGMAEYYRKERNREIRAQNKLFLREWGMVAGEVVKGSGGGAERYDIRVKWSRLKADSTKSSEDDDGEGDTTSKEESFTPQQILHRLDDKDLPQQLQHAPEHIPLSDSEVAALMHGTESSLGTAPGKRKKANKNGRKKRNRGNGTSSDDDEDDTTSSSEDDEDEEEESDEDSDCTTDEDAIPRPPRRPRTPKAPMPEKPPQEERVQEKGWQGWAEVPYRRLTVADEARLGLQRITIPVSGDTVAMIPLNFDVPQSLVLGTMVPSINKRGQLTFLPDDPRIMQQVEIPRNANTVLPPSHDSPLIDATDLAPAVNLEHVVYDPTEDSFSQLQAKLDQFFKEEKEEVDASRAVAKATEEYHTLCRLRGMTKAELERLEFQKTNKIL